MKKKLALILATSCLFLLGGTFIGLYNLKTYETLRLHEIIRTIQSEQAATINKFHLLNHILKIRASSSDLAPALMNKGSQSPANMEDFRWILNNMKKALNALAVFILDNKGTCIVSTEPAFMEKNYGFRPYFKDAMSRGSGTYLAKGMTSRRFGLYMARRIHGSSHVMVLKMDPCKLLSDTAYGNNEMGYRSYLATEDGVLLDQECNLFSLVPLSDKSIEKVRFPGEKITPMGFKEGIFQLLTAKRRIEAEASQGSYHLAYFPLVENALGIVTLVDHAHQTPELNRLKKGMIALMILYLSALLSIIIQTILLKRQQGYLEEKERELESARYRLNLLDTAIEQTANSFIITDPDGVIEYVNPAFEKITGYSADEVIGQKPNILKSGRQKSAFYEELWKVICSGQVWHGRFCNRKKDGSIFWEDTVITPIKDKSGQICHFVAIKYDVTRLIGLEEELNLKMRELETIMENAPVGISLIRNQRFIKVNRDFGNILGVPHEALLGQHVSEVFDSMALYERFFLGQWLPVLMKDHGISTEHVRTRPDGTDQWLHVVASIAKHGPPEEMEIVCIIQDITERKELLSRVEEEKEKALAANQAKTTFLANMSHEIRTPLNGILGMLSLLDATHLNNDQKHFVKIAKQSAEILFYLINGILDISKIEAGTITLEEKDFDLEETIQSTLSLIEIFALEKSVELHYTIDKSVPVHVRGDRNRLQQILLNLVNNAVKFTEGGWVKVSVTMMESSETDVVLKFMVSDTGIGIPKELQDQLFQKFNQLDPSISRRYGGTGLGLSICKQLVELMDGEIGVVSEKGHGSTFWFTVRLQRVESQGDGISSALTGPGLSASNKYTKLQGCEQKRVLVVDDNIINQHVALGMLRNLGVRAEAVSSGEDALEVLSSISYDLVFMDIQMPGMDGLEATRKIRESRGVVLDPDIPVVALSAHAGREDYERARAAGMNDYMKKPIMPEVLINILEKWLGCKRQADGEEPGGAPPVNGSQDKEEDHGEPSSAPHFERDDLLERTMGDEGIYKKVIEAFITNTPSLLERLQKALEDEDLTEIKRTAHTLKGSSANSGAKRLSVLAERLENMALGAPIDTLKESVEGMIAEFHALKEILAQELGLDQDAN